MFDFISCRLGLQETWDMRFQGVASGLTLHCREGARSE